MTGLKKMLKFDGRFWRGALKSGGLVMVMAFLAGCEPLSPGVANDVSPRPQASGQTHFLNPGSDMINVGDAVTVTFSDLPMVIPSFEERVKSDGSVTLLYSKKFQFAGKSRGDLEAEIRERYVPSYFNNLTVTIKLADRFYFVDGEVKLSNKYNYSGEMTVLKAIASAGGFTDFAKRSKVRLTRAGGKTLEVDADAALENPALDLPVYAGDRITVPRKLW